MCAVKFLELISTSAKTGVFPVFITALAVETHVQLGIITSPFFLIVLSAHSKALVHEFIETAYLTLINLARSKQITTLEQFDRDFF